jgi:hypothetical protein
MRCTMYYYTRKIAKKTPNKIINYMLMLTKIRKLYINAFSHLSLKINTHFILSV